MDDRVDEYFASLESSVGAMIRQAGSAELELKGIIIGLGEKPWRKPGGALVKCAGALVRKRGMADDAIEELLGGLSRLFRLRNDIVHAKWVLTLDGNDRLSIARVAIMEGLNTQDPDARQVLHLAGEFADLASDLHDWRIRKLR